jgi:hypothetical protein
MLDGSIGARSRCTLYLLTGRGVTRSGAFEVGSGPGAPTKLGPVLPGQWVAIVHTMEDSDVPGGRFAALHSPEAII